jgi:hypothetical protein
MRVMATYNSLALVSRPREGEEERRGGREREKREGSEREE